MAKRGKASSAGEASVPPALSASERETVDASVASLSGLNLDQLRLQWRNQLDARPFAPRGPTTREGVGLKSGALLVREWSGRLERVMVLDDGYAWNGCVYRSLSQVAKAITGTHWNGHRFFGLKAVRSGAPNRKRVSASTTPGATPAISAALI